MVDDTLIEVGTHGPVLRAGRCAECGATSFPIASACARCSATTIDVALLPPEGTLWTFTIQNFRPKRPYDGSEDFEPYGVGYVDFGQVLVEGRLTANTPPQLSIGQRMRTALVPYGTDDEGNEILTFAFAPVHTNDGEARA
jgi:uncharacterized OB-fold protein